MHLQFNMTGKQSHIQMIALHNVQLFKLEESKAFMCLSWYSFKRNNKGQGTSKINTNILEAVTMFNFAVPLNALRSQRK